MIELLKQLDKFRESKNFKRFGFAIGGNNNSWIKGVEKLCRSDDNHTHECACYLANIGYAYVTNKGVDNDSIKGLRKYFHEKLLQNV